MTRDVYHIVNPAENPVIPVLVLNGGITGKVWPVTPVLAVLVPAVLLVILSHISVPVPPYRLKRAGPGILDTYIARLALAPLDFFTILVVDYRMDTGYGRAGAARLHRVYTGQCAAEETSGLRLPPRINYRRLAFSHHFVIPFPHLWFDWLSDGGHMLEVVIVFCRFVGPDFPQAAYGRRSGMEDIYVKLLRYPPRPTGIGINRHPFVNHRGGT